MSDMSYSMTDIGKRIAALRDERDISQDDLAKAIPVTREVVAKWETGLRDMKTQHTVRVAQHFGISCDEILTGHKADNTGIHERTGLSDKAVERLEARFKQNCDRLAILNYLFESDKMEDLCETILLNSYVEYEYQNRKEITKGKTELNSQKVVVQAMEATDVSGSEQMIMNIDYGEYRKFHRFRLANALQRIAEKTCEYIVKVYHPERIAAEKKKYEKSE